MEKRNVKRQKKEQNPDLNKKKNGSKKIGTWIQTKNWQRK